MKTISTFCDLKHRLAILVLGLTLALPVHAAITDADLAKVTQLIQEGKTTRAKAEITILLDANPNDANASKLRKILDSLGNQNAGNVAKPSGQDGGPSAEETLQWIQAHIEDLRYYMICHKGSNFGRRIRQITMKEGQLEFVEMFTSFGDLSATKLERYTVNITNLTGAIEIRKEDSSEAKNECSPSEIMEIYLGAKSKTVTEISSEYTYIERSGRSHIDGAKVERLENPIEELERRLKNGQGERTTQSWISIPIRLEPEPPEMAVRFKKAFVHLLELHGVRESTKPEAF